MMQELHGIYYVAVDLIPWLTGAIRAYKLMTFNREGRNVPHESIKQKSSKHQLVF